MKKIFVFLLALMSLISCERQKSERKKSLINEKLLEVKISERSFNKDDDYTNYINSIEVIKLETNPNSLIGRIKKIEYVNSNIYILTDSQVLLIYDKNGKCLKKLDKNGKGMGEYIEVKDFYVDNDNYIKILSYNTILTYNSDLKYIGSKKIKAIHEGKELVPRNFLPNGNFTFLFVGSFGIRDILPDKHNALYCVDNDMNKIITEFLPVYSKYTMGHKNFYRSNEVTYFTDTYGNDTIYQIHDNYLIPKLFIDFSEKKITTKDMMKNRNTLYNTVCENKLCGNLMNIYENSDFLCFQFTEGSYIKQGVYNRKTKSLKILNVANNLPFPKIIAEGTINDHFFTTIEPFLLLNNPTNRNYSDFIKKYNLSDLKETDNPIIIKFKFKF